MFGAIKVIDDVYQPFFGHFGVAESSKISVGHVCDKVSVDISAAASRSVFLNLAIGQAASLRAN